MAGKSFKGNLEVLNLSDIFQSLAMNRHSGTLIVDDGKREKKIFFAEGEICLLTSGRRMRIGDLLIADGKITEEDLDLALKLQKQSRKKLGEILVEEGFCEPADIDAILRLQIEEELYDLFLWRKAEFEFQADSMPDEMARDSPNLTRLHINTNSLIMEALRRLDEWSLIQDAVPSTKEVFVVVDAEAIQSSDVLDTVKADHEGIDGKTTVMGLAERWFISEFECCQHLANLVRCGGIRSLGQEELVDRAESAYALNDFAAAAALYGRLAEYHADQAKILIPLADSLRRTGGERQALQIYELLSEQLEQGKQDPDRLRQCYEAILQLDPSRHDLARKIEDLDLALAASGGGKKIVPIAILVILLMIGGAAFIFREEIQAAISPKPVSGEDVVKLIDQITRAEKEAQPLVLVGKLEEASKPLARWHEIACQIWTDHRTSAEFGKVSLPVLVATSPPGFVVYVQYGGKDYYQGKTSLAQAAVLCKFEPTEDADGNPAPVLIRVYDSEKAKEGGFPPRAELEIPSGTYRQPVILAIYDKPATQIIVDGWLDRGAVVTKDGSTVLLPSRSGKLRAFSVEKGRLVQTGSWDGKVVLGEIGDPLSRPAIYEGQLLVGCPEAGGSPCVQHLPLSKGEVPGSATPRYKADSQIAGRPIVVRHENEALVVFATSGATAYAYTLSGEERWKTPLVGPVSVDPVALPDGRVAFLCEDDHVRVIEVASGRQVWDYASDEALGQQLLLLRKDLLLSTESGKVIQVNAESGEVGETLFTDKGGREPTLLLGAKNRLIVGTTTGHIISLRDGEVEWDTPLKRVSLSRPRLALTDGQVLAWISGRDLIRLELKAGKITWLGRYPQEGRVVSPLVPLQGGVLLSTHRNLLYYFVLPKEAE
ncbi:MAG: DUF4388 domain-containing protein [Planctomycetes bacterium]|nr:DUF4388 domain-containing protein [Planctomycetota bacterium]